MPDTYLPGDTRQRIQDLIKSRKITRQNLLTKSAFQPLSIVSAKSFIGIKDFPPGIYGPAS